MSKKSDFLSWDDDIDLDNLLGDYTDCDDYDELANDSDDFECIFDGTNVKNKKLNDENEPTCNKKQKTNKSTLSTNTYKCPECGKCLKSIAGFRGHMTKQHNLPNTKASDFKVDDGLGTAKLKVKTPTFSDETQFKVIFSESYKVSLKKLQIDPMATMFAPVCHFQLIEHATSNEEFQELLQSWYSSIFHKSSVNLSLSADREQLFNEFHKMRINPDVRATSLKLFESVQCSDSEKMDFLQWFFMDLINEILIQQLKVEQKTSSEKNVKISDNDQKILYYIAGYIIRSVKKRYQRSNSHINELKEELLSKLVNDGSSSFVKEFSGWVSKVDRGGLYKPSDDYYLLIKEFEIVMRQHVNIDTVSAKSLMVTELTELILESFMVKHYSVRLFGSSSDRALAVLEDIISFFLKVRGFAIARVQRNKICKDNGTQKKSLRKSLQEKSLN